MIKAYIAGPITGKGEEEIRQSFGNAAASLRSYGILPISPVDLDVFFDDGVCVTPTLSNRRKFARRDTGIIINELKAEDGDFILMLDGWIDSKGATAERALGIWVGLPILRLGHIGAHVEIWNIKRPELENVDAT